MASDDDDVRPEVKGRQERSCFVVRYRPQPAREVDGDAYCIQREG
ncbi:hypothetical protein QFZ60_000810 [Arthrobacter sp. B2I5]|nr:hypothetical protein [Arthrobacter sp. B2I5]MDQ0824637.1 hypothetical protein [Arthrobacter sp. B2I5]